MAGDIAATAAPARRDSRLLSMTSPSTSSATALGCARSVTSEHLSLHHITRSESDLDSALALRDAQRTVHHPHIADGLPRRNRFRGACLRRIVTFSQTCATCGWSDLVGGSKERGERFSMFALRTCANIVSFLLVTKNEIGAERVPVWEASEKCSGQRSRDRSAVLVWAQPYARNGASSC